MGNIKEKIAILFFATTVNAEVLYQDNNITVTDEGVFSTRTGKPIEFRQAPDWEEEDFFTQQSKYCEVGGKENGIQRKGP